MVTEAQRCGAEVLPVICLASDGVPARPSSPPAPAPLNPTSTQVSPAASVVHSNGIRALSRQSAVLPAICVSRALLFRSSHSCAAAIGQHCPQVHLCGSFTRWVETVPMAPLEGGQGAFAVVVHLPPG